MTQDKTQTTKSGRWEFQILQDGMTQASVEGPYKEAKSQAEHYAFVYGQDGPVEIKEIKIYD